jgi:hypothetical protein
MSQNELKFKLVEQILLKWLPNFYMKILLLELDVIWNWLVIIKHTFSMPIEQLTKKILIKHQKITLYHLQAKGQTKKKWVPMCNFDKKCKGS